MRGYLSYLEKREIVEILGAAKYKQLTREFLLKLEDLDHWTSDAPPLCKAAALDEIGVLESHNLTVADKSSMSNGVELRVPFLDIDIVRRQKANFSSRRTYKGILQKGELKLVLHRFSSKTINLSKKTGI